MEKEIAADSYCTLYTPTQMYEQGKTIWPRLSWWRKKTHLGQQLNPLYPQNLIVIQGAPECLVSTAWLMTSTVNS